VATPFWFFGGEEKKNCKTLNWCSEVATCLPQTDRRKKKNGEEEKRIIRRGEKTNCEHNPWPGEKRGANKKRRLFAQKGMPAFMSSGGKKEVTKGTKKLGGKKSSRMPEILKTIFGLMNSGEKKRARMRIIEEKKPSPS